MRNFALALTLIPALCGAQASPLQNYLAQRSKQGIREAASVAALETLVGKRTTEIQGLVKGSIRFGDSGTLMLETASGKPISVSATPVPEWMMGGNVSARLIIRATREHETAPLRAELVAAIPEDQMATWEARNKPRPKPAPKPQTGKTPPPLQGEIGRPSSNAKPSAARTWYVPASDAVPFYRDYIRQQNKRLPADEADRIARSVIGFSLQYGVDARLVMAMIMVESGFNPNSTSRSGAMGLGQLMPGTARGLGVSNAYDSVENLYGMVKLIRGHIDNYTRQTGGDEYQSLVLMLAAYNAGSGAVRRHGGVPPYRETQNYVRKVTELYRQLSGQ